MIPELEVVDFYDFLYDYISPGIRSGTYTIIKNTMISPIRYGITDLEIRSIGSPVPDRTDHRILHDRICSASDPGTYVIV